VPTAHHPQDARRRQYHIGLGPGEVAPTILLAGDVDRAARIAETFDTLDLERRSREYRTFTGTRHGRPLTAMATGMGSDNTEIALVELAQIVDSPVLIRVGSTGALQPDIELGDLVISTGALRYESTSASYAPPEYPALAHPEVLLALVAAAHELGHRHHVGLTATLPGFYASQGRELPPFATRHPERANELARLGVLNMEMEASCLFVLGGVAGLRTGAVCAVYANRQTGDFIAPDLKRQAESAAIHTALGAVDILAAMDQRRDAAGAPLWHPRLAADRAGAD
jgi:uridine phosphorylase